MRYVMVMSGKGGVGKTTVACNLAAALSTAGKSVGFIDADLYNPNSHVLLGLPEERIVEDLGARKLVPARVSGIEFMSIAQVIPRGVGLNLPAEKVRDVILTMLSYVQWTAEYIVIDCPPGSLDINLELLRRVPRSYVVFVAQPHPMALEGVLRIVDVAAYHGARGLCMVLNMVNLFPEHIRRAVERELRKLGLDIVEIPWEQDLVTGLHPEKPYFQELAKRVIG